jgi:hypothetical protein
MFFFNPLGPLSNIRNNTITNGKVTAVSFADKARTNDKIDNTSLRLELILRYSKKKYRASR